MLFNSIEFIFFFLPIAFIIYFILIKCRFIEGSKVWLVLSSLFFYSWWNIAYLPLILISIVVNFIIGRVLSKQIALTPFYRKLILIGGLVFNVSLLGYFKYADFFLENVNFFAGTSFDLLHLTLPLAISFFTFQQIAFLVDSYNRDAQEHNILNYSLFVSFFPQLIAGPIVHHKEMMPQYASLKNKLINYKNISIGMFIFSIGLFKKVAIADTFATWANVGFSSSATLTMLESWVVSLSYTFQLYFDFSGYTDMAIGLALLFNIKIPINFYSPYKALNIQDFWRRWHMTLSRFLTQYVYIPLGGNRKGINRTYINIMIIFVISGLWHGAGWTFIFWGFLHGFATVINRFWSKFNIHMPVILAWFITFNFINITWVFFRAETWTDATNVIKAMVGFNGVGLPNSIANAMPFIPDILISSNNFEGLRLASVMIVLSLIVVLFFKNSNQMSQQFKPSVSNALIFLLAIAMTLFIYFIRNTNSEFLYFNF